MSQAANTEAASAIYRHFLDRRVQEPPEQIIERFRALFIAGKTYPDPLVQASLQQILASPNANRDFPFVLNRCCYILLNWWLISYPVATCRQATITLIALFDTLDDYSAESSFQQRLRSLVTQFRASDHYRVLQSYRQVLENGRKVRFSEDETIDQLVSRYYFMYPYYVKGMDSSELGYQALDRLQNEVETEYQRDLFDYSRHLVRSPSVRFIDNPTLLTDEQIRQALFHFSGKVEGDRTLKESATRLQIHCSQASSYRGVKQEIYRYLTDSLQHSPCPDYGKHQFNYWLEERLGATLHQFDRLQPSPHLRVKTGVQLIADLLCCPQLRGLPAAYPYSSDHAGQKNHLQFIDLISNLGATFTVGFLMKILLIVSDIKPGIAKLRGRLEQQLTFMFRYYESKFQGQVKWLIDCLENLLVAFTANFSRYNFSHIQ
ncbi:MAG TPA: hypothetical protein IGS37_18800 [Synechococcales cyanobacterium M55_K2018_004]|nr:hypothetical protein [Synechococcales cyanobacterium M55_K2018_004]